MDLAQELAEVEEQLADAEQEALRWAARAEGLRAQVEALRRAVELSTERAQQSRAAVPDLRLLNRTAAIQEILRLSGTPLGISEILAALKAGGRQGDHYSVVSATLQQLVTQGRVQRPQRGRYSA